VKPSRASILNWVRNALTEGHPVDGMPRVMILRHLVDRGAGLGARSIQQWALKGPYPEQRVAELADQIIQCAAEDAGEKSYLQEYVIEAYCGQNTRPSLHKRLEFEAVIISAEQDDDEFGNQPSQLARVASPQTVANVALKSLERVVNVGTAPPIAVMDRMSRNEERLQLRIEQLEARIDKMVNERLEQMATYEELLSHKHQRDLELQKVKFREEMVQQVFTKAIVPLAPAIANRMLGAQIDEASSPKALILKNFIESLKPEELFAIQAAIPQEKLAPIMDMIKAAVEEDEAVKKAAQAAQEKANGAIHQEQ
jgi:hypothetical protein